MVSYAVIWPRLVARPDRWPWSLVAGPWSLVARPDRWPRAALPGGGQAGRVAWFVITSSRLVHLVFVIRWP